MPCTGRWRAAPAAPILGLQELGRRWLGEPDEPASGWLEHRLRLGVCEGRAELGDVLWLECNAIELNGVSFTKGCFVGQENTARMNWRQKVNRRLVVVPTTRSRTANPRRLSRSSDWRSSIAAWTISATRSSRIG